ncbi:serine-rich coiled-coil domain-containing protein 2-like [Mugil cephalus]|uniref:serine-rich coiled-coil domain-containing protein 2-like n=1 Tax=Mugil cephalus TaxID=48193 RepID=UPI001FB6D9E8|nr:serine-rich coiled-coil domain-containing protein 2-like [Mugil cephalus]XP_047464978.1 serine-rich coiled-coil domain-containing protein 2-like [Mugil cephalus]
MSAPPLTNPPAMPTMVSRLPKFGSRPKSQTLPSTRLTNGFYHHPGPEGVSGSSTATTPSAAAAAKQNGFIRVPGSFQKWRMEGGETEKEARRGKVGNGGGFHQYYSQRPSPRETKRPTASSPGKGRGLPQQPVTSSSSSSSSPQSSPRTLPVSKSLSPFSKPSQAAASRPKLSGPNAVPGSGPRTGSSLRRPQSFARGFRPSSGSGSQSGSPGQSKTRAGRSFSSDNLGSAPSVPLTQSDRLRSRSLNQVQRQPSPTLTPALSLPRPPKAPPRSRSSPIHTQEGGANGGGVFSSLLPPSALKKPLLPSLGSASKPSGISYRLSRPSLIKQSRPLRVSAANERGSDQEVRGGLNGRRNLVETPSTENSPEITPDAPEVGGLPVSQGEVSIVGETLEDMSLSSTSSLERNDTSQEYMDDFDNLGNGGVGILLLSSKNDEDDSGLDQSCARFDSDDKMTVNGVAKETGLCFLDDGVDWADVRLGGGRGEHRLNRLSHRRRSSQPDDHDQGGSSLDLSPSDSCGSGGTYMWDEEGLEPLGGAATTASIHTDGNTTHHIGSFDSDLNSIDILNNLDSCDLGDDDLMLDVDLPEDASLHGGGFESQRQTAWRALHIHYYQFSYLFNTSLRSEDG